MQSNIHTDHMAAVWEARFGRDLWWEETNKGWPLNWEVCAAEL